MKLTDRQKKTLKAWEDTDAECDVLSFSTIALRANIARCDVRRTVRDMARRGYTRYVRCGWSDDGLLGSGYTLTEAGRLALSSGSEKP